MDLADRGIRHALLVPHDYHRIMPCWLPMGNPRMPANEFSGAGCSLEGSSGVS